MYSKLFDGDFIFKSDVSSFLISILILYLCYPFIAEGCR